MNEENLNLKTVDDGGYFDEIMITGATDDGIAIKVYRYDRPYGCWQLIVTPTNDLLMCHKYAEGGAQYRNQTAESIAELINTGDIVDFDKLDATAEDYDSNTFYKLYYKIVDAK